MPSILAFRHVPHETLGSIKASLARTGLDFRYVDLFDAMPERPAVEEAAGLIVLGGPMNVDQIDEYPYLGPEVDWIRQAVDAGLPVLGICLGSQLIAKALGALVYPNRTKEIGWYEIQRTAEADADPLFGNVAPDGSPSDDLATDDAPTTDRATVFQWHGDTFDLPAGTVRLARSELCENQAFRHGDRTWGLQFHLEVTAEMVDEWLNVPENASEVAALEDVDPRAIREQTPTKRSEMEVLGRVVFDRFATICRAR